MQRTSLWLGSVLATSLMAVLLGACGGGGAGAPGADGGGDPPAPVGPTAEQTRQALAACGPEALEAFLHEVDVFLQILAGQGAAAGVSVEGGAVESQPGFRVPLLRDDDGDFAPDAIGFLVTEDGAGAPSAPFLDAELDPLRANGIGELPALLGALDGHVLLVDFTAATAPALDGTYSTPFSGGVPGAVSADARANVGTCEALLSFADLPRGNFAGAFPVGVLAARFTDGADVLVGTLTANGTASVSASIAHNAAPARNFVLNLTTGEVQIAP